MSVDLSDRIEFAIRLLAWRPHHYFEPIAFVGHPYCWNSNPITIR